MGSLFSSKKTQNIYIIPTSGSTSGNNNIFCLDEFEETVVIDTDQMYVQPVLDNSISNNSMLLTYIDIDGIDFEL